VYGAAEKRADRCESARHAGAGAGRSDDDVKRGKGEEAVKKRRGNAEAV